MTLQDILTKKATLAAATARAQAALQRKQAAKADAVAKVEALKASSEPFALSPPSHIDKVRDDFAAEWAKRRTLAAGAARFQVEALVGTFEADVKAFTARQRRDVVVTMPSALEGLDANGMIGLATLRELRRATVARLSVAELHAVYQGALARRDAASLIDCELVEERVAAGGVAQSEGELSAFRALADHVSGVQDLRIPLDLADAAEVIEQARHTVAQAEQAGVRGVNVAHDPGAAKVAEQELAAMA